MYAIAFASLGVQVDGLVGEAGILPAGEFLRRVADRLGPDAYARLPTICWLVGADARTLQLLCAAGVACGLALLAGVLPGPAALAAWALYLSLVGVGQVFLAFQWDALLLESGLLALLIAPWRLRPPAWNPSAVGLLPLWCLVAKLHLLSGWVKLASGDPTWWNLTALHYHYWTTCLPVWVGWYAAKLPDLVQRASVLVMFAIELGAPFAILGPRRLRHAAAAAMIALQLAIAVTGNYGFFNLLTIALCATLFDDAALARVLPFVRAPVARRPSAPRRLLAAAAAAAACGLVLLPLAARVVLPEALARPALHALEALAPLHSVNAYGLFANMTTVRPEIVVEGSDDGVHWRPYEFRWKPGDPHRRPGFVQPHMPRLDWQMWFAALQGYQRTYWFGPFLDRLLDGSPAVTRLLGEQPFPGSRPRYVRAVLYRYEFASPAERRAGLWWRREPIGMYTPVRRRADP
ncbi:MAG TPA: lipase maturation factor family protein [Candidatus Limnocylindria bacterium]|nr:lipase maturation factor family protein [Candidatus Limnocylindria bacterium]